MYAYIFFRNISATKNIFLYCQKNAPLFLAIVLFQICVKFHMQNYRLEKNYFLVKSTFNSYMRFLFIDKSPTIYILLQYSNILNKTKIFQYLLSKKNFGWGFCFRNMGQFIWFCKIRWFDPSFINIFVHFCFNAP